MNAVDYGDPIRQEHGYLDQAKKLSELGFQPFRLDLREYFHRPTEIKDVAQKLGAIWINGGNVFVLKRAFEQSGFAQAIKPLVEQNQLVYAGYSAAAYLAGPSLHGAEIVDDPNTIPDGYQPEFAWDGLGFTDFYVAVHFDSDHSESPKINEEIQYFQVQNLPYKTLRDGQVILVNDTQTTVLD